MKENYQRIEIFLKRGKDKKESEPLLSFFIGLICKDSIVCSIDEKTKPIDNGIVK